MKTTEPPWPIAVMAFNRADYLREVLQSLVAQTGFDLGGRPVTLFQDGGPSKYSAAVHATPAEIEASIAVFREFFPAGHVEASPVNLGVAHNFDRAERWAFDEFGAEAAIFLEDDLVLSPHYLAVLERLLALAIADGRIGYVGAFGDWLLPLREQSLYPGRLQLLKNNWAFGLTRQQWLKNRPFMDEYLSIINGVDYRQRPHKKIFGLYSRYGMDRVESSQDRAKLIAASLSGGLCVNTTACLGRYIGKVGLHLTEELFQERGMGKVEIFPTGEFEIEHLSDRRYQDLLAIQRGYVQVSFRRHCTRLARRLHRGARRRLLRIWRSFTPRNRISPARDALNPDAPG